MVKTSFLPITCCFIFFFFSLTMLRAEDFHAKMSELIYSPRYFGPNAFPLPRFRHETLSKKWEAEFGGQYHYYVGDETKNITARLYIPFKGVAGIEVSWIIKEDYKLSYATHLERHTADVQSPASYEGDIVLTSFFQLFRSEKWCDGLLSATIKTASGGRISDARFIDAAAYWFTLRLGRDLWRNSTNTWVTRAHILGGFYCWTTNDLVHRQNDASLWGAGLSSSYKNLFLSTNLTGLKGYEGNGDSPISWKNRLNLSWRNHTISFLYEHGMQDDLYETYGLSYLFSF